MDNNSFFSIDRLVEFGLGMTMATQMVEMMNKSIKQMYIPGSIDSIQARLFPTIYVDIDGTATGPLSENEFSKLVTSRKVNNKTLAWMPGLPGWEPIENVPQLLKIIALTPPPLPNQSYVNES